MKYLLLICSNPQTWGHPIFLRTQEAAAMTADERAADERAVRDADAGDPRVRASW